MKRLLYIFLVLITIIMTSCDSKESPSPVIISTSSWVLTQLDSVTVLCVPRFDNIKPFIIKTNNNEIN